MRDLDLISVCIDNFGLFDGKKAVFVRSMAVLLEKGRALSPAQHQYLQSCYDFAVAKRYGVEAMSHDKDLAAQRAIVNSRKRSRVK